jgi:hypothetical protein
MEISGHVRLFNVIEIRQGTRADLPVVAGRYKQGL